MPRIVKLKNFDAAIALAIEDRDIAALDQMLDELIRISKKDAELAFTPALEFKPAVRNWDIAEEEGVLGDIAVSVANRISRAKRRVQYELKMLGGFDGLRIASDGDSWFQYPVLLRDIINVLSDDPDKAILSVDGAGDEVAQMLREKEYDGALRMTKGHVLLFSAGGNDLLGGGRFLDILKPFTAGAAPEDLVKDTQLRQRIDTIIGDYRKVIRDVGERHPGVVIVGHGYDVAYPRRGGKWLGQALEQRKIPLDAGREIVKLILDRFNDALAGTARDFSHYRHIDLRGRVGRGEDSWHDELHPKNEGYARAANEFREVLANLAREMVSENVPRTAVTAPRVIPPSRRSIRSTQRPSSVPSEATGATIVIDPGHGGRRDLRCSDANHAVGPVHGLLEKNLTLDVATRVKRAIDSAGRHRCILTRDRDENISGHDRAGVARSNSAAVFVSIHFNASTAHNAQGTETWVHTNAGDTDASARLCRAVQAAVRRATGLADRNSLHPPHFIKKASFCVINPANHADETAAVLVEVSFLDRADEEERLKRDSYRDEIAAAVAAGIDVYLDGTGPETIEEAAMAEVELEDGVSFYALRSRVASGQKIKTAEGKESPGRGLELRDALRLFPRAERSDAYAEADDAGEFRHMAIGDAPDFGIAAANARAAQRIAETMFSGLEEASFDFDAFGRFIGGLGLRHFSPIEFLFLGNSNEPGRGRCSGKNELPAEELWDSIGNTARMLDEIRSRLGRPVKILSAYRNEAYNTCIGGERGSLHLRFNAIDWTCTGGNPEQWLDIAHAVRASHPDFDGGVGFYPDKRFIHIDTRGREANW
jgi:N-acetylmuramoyl-L-alanine amidase